jgi:hypothetical protein
VAGFIASQEERARISDLIVGGVAPALREHRSATPHEHSCYFHRPDCVLICGHYDLRSRGIMDYPVTAITVTHCDGRGSTDMRYPPIRTPDARVSLAARAAPVPGDLCEVRLLFATVLVAENLSWWSHTAGRRPAIVDERDSSAWLFGASS